MIQFSPDSRKRLLRLARNRYLLVSLAAIIWVLFFDRFDVRSQLKMREKVVQLQQDTAYYHKAITDIRTQHQRLETESEELERLAREQYLMKRPNEDLYIVVEE